MSLTYLRLIILTVSIIVDLVMQGFFELSFIEQIAIVIGLFLFFSLLEYLKFFHKIEDWIKNKKYWDKFFKKESQITVSLKLPDFLFTAINPYRSLFDIGKELDKLYNLPTGSSFSLLLQGYWKGEFDGDNCQGIDRLTLLKNLHNTDCINEYFIFAYSYAKKPNIITELPNGGCRIDIRPVLPVPNANTDTWTNENCKEAFKVFVKKFQYSYSYFPDCIPDFLHPGFMECKKISQDVLVGFLKKQKVI